MRWMALIVILILAACQSAPSDGVLPTLASLHTQTPTATITPPPTATFTPSPTTTPTRVWAEMTPAEVDQLLDTTPLMSHYGAHMREIAARGRDLAQRSDVVLAVGDCNTVSPYFLTPLVDDEYRLRSAGDAFVDDPVLSQTAAYFTKSLDYRGQAARIGLNAYAVMDAMWTDSAACQPGESPLACDYRIQQPVAATIMFGANDVIGLTPANYEYALRDIIEYSISEGVIPVLNTFPYRSDGEQPAKARHMNAIIIALSHEYRVPLVNYWRASQTLEEYGLYPDNAHMLIAGFNERNRLTLHMLDYLRREVLAEQG